MVYCERPFRRRRSICYSDDLPGIWNKGWIQKKGCGRRECPSKIIGCLDIRTGDSSFYIFSSGEAGLPDPFLCLVFARFHSVHLPDYWQYRLEPHKENDRLACNTFYFDCAVLQCFA